MFPVALWHDQIRISERLPNRRVENQLKPGWRDWQTVAGPAETTVAHASGDGGY